MSSDIWAAGVTLFEMLSGYIPFESAKAIKTKPPKPLPTRVSKPVADLLTNLLSKNQAERKTALDIQHWFFEQSAGNPAKTLVP